MEQGKYVVITTKRENVYRNIGELRSYQKRF